MKISAINETVSLIANIGVIGSIVFLGLEMQQNTEMMQSQTRNSIVENQLSFYERGIEHSELADVRNRLGSGQDIKATEQFQYTFFMLSQMRMWENEFYQFQLGLFDSAEFTARTNAWRRQMERTANLPIWRNLEDAFAPDFRNFMNKIISEIS